MTDDEKMAIRQELFHMIEDHYRVMQALQKIIRMLECDPCAIEEDRVD